MTDYLAAAQSLIIRLNAPPQAHSVYVQTAVDDETKEFKKSLCVSIRPSWKAKVKVPTEHLGIPVVEVPWPKGA